MNPAASGVRWTSWRGRISLDATSGQLRALESGSDSIFAHVGGKRVAVFSDYPDVEKVSALGLQAWPIVCATDDEVARLKPDPAGLLRILNQSGVHPNRALMIGDRFDRDGLAARRANVRALIRSRRVHPEFETFQGFDDAIFAPLLHAATDGGRGLGVG